MLRVMRFLFAVALMILVILAWRKALGFDPYSDAFLTKTYVEPSPEMPSDMRIVGWVFVAVAALLFIDPVVAFVRKRIGWRHLALMVYLASVMMAFGGATFVAAERAEVRIEQEMEI
ncbi:hypothetical protein WJS89_09550 [Sphingomicrobium sp. XHP0235]|uniref:hypothetical protein n=1 Tax=Sphingomicrobium aquimarinum TaxID=3133971 RepID=UPI0031FEE3D2